MRDREGRLWEFVVKSWANGTEHRRVYVLEHAAEYIASKRLREGDVVGICADVQGALVVEVGRHSMLRRLTDICRDDRHLECPAVGHMALTPSGTEAPYAHADMQTSETFGWTT